MLIYKKNKTACLCAAFSIFALFIIFINAKHAQDKVQYYSFPEYNISATAPIQYYSFPEYNISATN